MSLVGKRININCPMNIRDVYQRVKSACFGIQGMSVLSFSDTNFSIFLQTGVTIWSWGENIKISCHYLNNGQTQIQITPPPKSTYNII